MGASPEGVAVNKVIVVGSILVVAAAVYVLKPLLFPGASRALTLYCSVDQDQSQPVVADYRAATGKAVDLVGETEANRSVGITKRLEAEREHPVADVVWANEIMNTVALADLGVFAPLPKDLVEAFPERWRDAKGRFAAFAGRARILLVNTKLLPDRKDWPTSVADLLDPRFGGDGRRVAMARPLVGTTYTHAVALLTRDPEAAKKFFTDVAARATAGDVKVLPGNGSVMRMVADASNGVAWGLTDTDDARVAIEKGDPVEVVYPDQADGRPGTLVIPNTVAVVRGGDFPADAEAFVRWLLSKENEARLAAGPIANIPLRDDVAAPAHVKRPGRDFRAMEVEWAAVGRDRDRWQGFLAGLFQAK
jgi:iron(III) transport system substrate-binding protein